MSPVGLSEMLRGLPQSTDGNLLLGFETSDDAAIYRLDGETALVITADIITPPVDDPHLFGQIAAANAISDVYAMGGRPIACLNLLSFPSKQLGREVLRQIVEGALSKITEAGAVLAGGHTMEDEEPKFGLSVTGLVHPERYWTNSGARPGDLLVLTKPIGSGVLLNANREGRVSARAMEACLATLTTLNRVAAEVLLLFDAHAVTDVTGFGLAGHSLELARASDVTLYVETDAVPVLPEALAAYERGMTTGANAQNRLHIESGVRFEGLRSSWREEILVDPQTNGGLLAAVEAARGEELLAALGRAGVGGARCIGRAEPFDGRHSVVFF